MTTLQFGKSVTRLTLATVFSRGRRREVAVTIRQLTVEFRLKGERTTHSLPIEWLYKRAAQASVQEAKRVKQAEKKARKEAL